MQEAKLEKQKQKSMKILITKADNVALYKMPSYNELAGVKADIEPEAFLNLGQHIGTAENGSPEAAELELDSDFSLNYPWSADDLNSVMDSAADMAAEDTFYGNRDGY